MQRFLETGKPFDYQRNQDVIKQVKHALQCYEQDTFDENLFIAKLTRSYDLKQGYEKLKSAYVERCRQRERVFEIVSKIADVILQYVDDTDDKLSFIEAFDLNSYKCFTEKQFAKLLFRCDYNTNIIGSNYSSISLYPYRTKNCYLIEYLVDDDYQRLLPNLEGFSLNDIEDFKHDKYHKYLDKFIKLKPKFCDIADYYPSYIEKVVLAIPEQYRKPFLEVIGIKTFDDIFTYEIVSTSTSRRQCDVLEYSISDNLIPYINITCDNLINSCTGHEHQNKQNYRISDCEICKDYKDQFYDAISDDEFFKAMKRLLRFRFGAANKWIERMVKYAVENKLTVAVDYPGIYYLSLIRQIIDRSISDFSECKPSDLIELFYDQSDLQPISKYLPFESNVYNQGFITRWASYHNINLDQLPDNKIMAKVWVKAYPERITALIIEKFDVNKLTTEQQQQLLSWLI